MLGRVINWINMWGVFILFTDAYIDRQKTIVHIFARFATIIQSYAATDEDLQDETGLNVRQTWWSSFILIMYWFYIAQPFSYQIFVTNKYTGADSRFAPSQWETVLLYDDVSHWLGAILESDLYTIWYLWQWLTGRRSLRTYSALATPYRVIGLDQHRLS